MIVIGPVTCAQCRETMAETWTTTAHGWVVKLGCAGCDRGEIAFGDTLRDTRIKIRRSMGIEPDTTLGDRSDEPTARLRPVKP